MAQGTVATERDKGAHDRAVTQAKIDRPIAIVAAKLQMMAALADDAELEASFGVYRLVHPLRKLMRTVNFTAADLKQLVNYKDCRVMRITAKSTLGEAALIFANFVAEHTQRVVQKYDLP